jgi:N6-L-threonylcarbamoyladenine synthase
MGADDRSLGISATGHSLVLGIESSCDETAAAVVRAWQGPGGLEGEVVSHVLRSQSALHAPYGGVVPEIAARAHVEAADILVEEAMSQAGLRFQDLSAVAATAGPGLIGGVLVGLVTGKAIASVHDLPLLAINHLEGHALSPRLVERVAFPYLLLLVSGGHCQLLVVRGPGAYRRLGTTLDDAAGEAFDKTAKLLGLGYPGGPAVQAAAERGDAKAFAFPRPLAGRPGADFSFAGLKTAVRKAAESAPLSPERVADIAASAQAAIAESLEDRTQSAMALFEEAHPGAPRQLVVAGGVAANTRIRAGLTHLCETRRYRFVAPPLWLCTDNGAMIAWAGAERFALGQRDPMETPARPRWPLDAGAAPVEPTKGAKGARA